MSSATPPSDSQTLDMQTQQQSHLQQDHQSLGLRSPTMASQIGQFSLLPTTQTTTVTTTTTVSTKFPPVVFKKPRRRLSDWDPTNYPLKDSPTPMSLRRFTFALDGKPATFVESERSEEALVELQEVVQSLQCSIGNTTTTREVKTDDGRVSSTRLLNSGPPDVRKRSQQELSRNLAQSVAKRRHVSDMRLASSQQDAQTLLPFSPQPTRPSRASDLLSDGVDVDANASVYDAEESEPALNSRTEMNNAPTLDITSPQSLSLPSPSASPVTAGNTVMETESLNRPHQGNKSMRRKSDANQLEAILSSHQQAATMMEIPRMLETFDDLPQNIQSYLMYHLLKRCNKTTLQVVAGVVNPALKRDFLDLLPYELSLHVLSYLDARALTRASQVSKRWKQIVDEDEYTWKNRLENDQYYIEDGEFERAVDRSMIHESANRARRLSVHPEASNRSSGLVPSTPIVVKDQFEEMVNGGLKQPLVGQHIYRTIYKQHHIKFHSWMHPKRQPRHFSFESHGRHVVTCLQIDNEKIITGSEDANINIFDVRNGSLTMSLEGHEGGVWALQYQGDILVSGSTDRTVRVWNMITGQCLQVFEGHTSTVRCLQILAAVDQSNEDAHSHLIITGSRDSTLRIWKLPNLEDPQFPTMRSPGSNASEEDNPYFVRALMGHSQSVRAIAADSDILVSGSYDCTVRVWQISTGKCIHKLTGHSQKVYSVVLDSRQNRCISGSMDWKVKIWDLATGNCLYSLGGHTSLVGLLNFSHDRLVSAAADSTLRVWNPKSGQCTQTLTAHTGAITCFQHDGDKVISGSDGTLKLWDIKTGEFCRDLLTGLSYVWQVRFDDRRCVAAVQRNTTTHIEVLDFGAF